MIQFRHHYRDASWKAVLHPGMADDFFDAGMQGPIDASTNEFSSVNAWWLSELSRLVYRRSEDESGFMTEKPHRRDYLKRVGLEERAFFNAGGAQASFIVRDQGVLPAVGILVFRGTTGSWRTWRSNFNLWTSPWPRGGNVHSGFRKKFDSLWPAIENAVESWQAPLFYTGHSLGAALATLAAGRHPPQALYTFGSPRVGDAAFVQSLRSVRIFRLYNPGDIVPLMPPSGGIFPFRHAGIPIAYQPMDMMASTAPQQREAAPIQPFFPFTRPPRFLLDHAPANYVR